MSSRFEDAAEQPVEDVKPGFEEDDEGGKANWDERDAAFMRLKELNPDDFE
ncbi:hypothetical protein ACTMTI_32070 [Nonomuraea sp. H19]|uniref:hypothetical protein n=1 Tax=Nonomuraea sp. H19 TaxID=3452206 RepID=UPI003F8A4EB9